jgi:hypothetical protein
MYPEQLQNCSAYEHSNDAHRGSQDSESSWQSQQTYAMSNYSTPATEPMPWYLQEWARKNQAEAVNSRNGSTDFLPIQHPSTDEVDAAGEDEDMEEEEEEEEEQQGKELVGMGLYDLPESSLLGFSSLVEGSGKGLKLEETWQPPEDGDDEEQVDDASSEDDEEELPTAKENVNTQLPIQSVADKQMSGNMQGQSFFFDEDETYTKEWWFQQLKQPSMPVRDAGLGYGWL